MAESAQVAGMFLIGIGVGLYIPGLPAPVNIINPYLGLVFVILGVIAFLRR